VIGLFLQDGRLEASLFLVVSAGGRWQQAQCCITGQDVQYMTRVSCSDCRRLGVGDRQPARCWWICSQQNIQVAWCQAVGTSND
jgi:hypothetical protein